MPDIRSNASDEPTRAQVDALPGPTVVEFGAAWCGYCISAQAAIHAAVSQHPRVRHLKIEDGRGRPLGRSFSVKLWPTLVFLRDGVEVSRLVRPGDASAIRGALDAIDAAGNVRAGDAHVSEPGADTSP